MGLFTLEAFKHPAPMTKKILLHLFLALLSFPTWAQETSSLRGRILDAETNTPITYATIYCRTCQYGGGVSNQEGYFTLTGGTPGEQLQINHIMYGQQYATWPEADVTLEIKLESVPRSLPTIVVDPREAELLIRRAYRKLDAGKNQAYAGEAFYRQITMVDGQPNEIMESFAEIGQTTQGINRWEPITGRYGLDPAYAGFSATNFSWLSRGWKIFLEKPRKGPDRLLIPLYPPDLGYFDFAVREKISDGQGGEIAVIEFSPADKAPGVGTTGRLYVQTQDATLRKMEVSYDARKKTDMGKRTKLESARVNLDIDFHLVDGIPLVSLMRGQQSMRFKIKGAETYDMTMSSIMRPLEMTPTRRSSGRNPHRMKDLQEVKKARYDPRWWERYRIMVDTPLEEELLERFTSEGIMGNFNQ
jgi:hypothetical protein